MNYRYAVVSQSWATDTFGNQQMPCICIQTATLISTTWSLQLYSFKIQDTTGQWIPSRHMYPLIELKEPEPGLPHEF
jgi:hypothetical protein